MKNSFKIGRKYTAYSSQWTFPSNDFDASIWLALRFVINDLWSALNRNLEIFKRAIMETFSHDGDDFSCWADSVKIDKHFNDNL